MAIRELEIAFQSVVKTLGLVLFLFTHFNKRGGLMSFMGQINKVFTLAQRMKSMSGIRRGSSWFGYWQEIRGYDPEVQAYMKVRQAKQSFLYLSIPMYLISLKCICYKPNF